jgi:hypothetical protein
MSISLNQLKSAMNKITNAGYQEKTVNLGENSITIKTLTPKEESELQKVMSDLSRQEDVTTLEFVDQVRKETLSRAIIQINNIDLRNVDKVETGEILENGTPVSIPRQEAVAIMVEELPRVLLGKVFEEMSKLTEEVEERTNKLLKPDSVNLDVEIDSLEKRIQQLKMQKESQKLDENVAKSTSNLLKVKGEDSLSGQLKKVEESV